MKPLRTPSRRGKRNNLLHAIRCMSRQINLSRYSTRSTRLVTYARPSKITSIAYILVICASFLSLSPLKAQTPLAPDQTITINTLTSEDYIIPEGIESLTIEVRGADGGNARLSGGTCDVRVRGGQGATMKVTFRVGPDNSSDPSWLRYNGIIRVFAGRAGQNDDSGCAPIPVGRYGAGGGSSAILYQPPFRPNADWELLAVAGGGGGGARVAAGVFRNGLGGNVGGNGDNNSGGNGGTNGNCGQSVQIGLNVSGYGGGGIRCEREGAAGGTMVLNGYIFSSGNPFNESRISLFPKPNSDATETGGTIGIQPIGGDGFTGGAAGAGGGGGGGGFSGGAGASSWPGGGGGSYITPAFTPTNITRQAGADGTSTNHPTHGFAKITTKSICPTGDIALNSQQEVNDFVATYPNCAGLTGSLEISGADITDLSPLMNLTSIWGDLRIIQNGLLTNLDGISNLTYIGNNLTINENPLLTDFEGLCPLFVAGFSESNFSQDANGSILDPTIDCLCDVDDIAPEITCVENTSREILLATSSYTIQGTEFDPQASDNCGLSSLSNNINGMASLAGEQLNVGSHEIIWTAQDEKGNVANCTTNVVIEYADREYFITTWKTTVENESITIPTTGGGYNYTVDWGDGTIESNQTGNATHSYATPGIHTVRIIGDFPRISFDTFFRSEDKNKILTIEQWGAIQWKTMEGAFYACSNLNISNPDIDTPDLSEVTDLSLMFYDNKKFDGDINDWDVSKVRNFKGMFYGASVFNQNIGNWDTGEATDMTLMFSQATAFNQDIGRWDVSNVTKMGSMFNSATAFNQDIGNWNTSNVTSLNGMFSGARSFNQDIGNWDVSNATNMSAMFYSAVSFNRDIGEWDVRNVINMSQMFEGAYAFDQDLGNWNVESVTSFYAMFYRSSLSTQNYDALLIGWSRQHLQAGINFNAGTSKYCAGEAARAVLIAEPNNWTIRDAGVSDPSCVIPASDYFVTTWETTGANGSITIPTTGSGYNYVIDWGDGIFETGKTGNATHSYANPGIHTVRIAGDFPRIYFPSSTFVNARKIQTIEQWGNIQWQSMMDAFNSCRNLNITNPDIDIPDLSNVTNMSFMFDGATSFNHDIGNWNVENVTNMKFMFSGAETFNQDIGNWNVGNVTNMHGMFWGATSFNQDIGNWNTSNVIDMQAMFLGATSFNQDIGNWNVSNVTNMLGVFWDATSFNQDIGNWNVSNVESMEGMFLKANSFDQDIGNWNVSNVTDMRLMFFDTRLSISNYDALLIGWSARNLRSGIEFHAGGSQYCMGAEARAILTSAPNNWTITDGGEAVVIENINVLNTSTCDPWTNTYSQTLEIFYNDEVNGGSIIVNGQSFPATGSPQTVELTGLVSDGQAVDVTVYASDYAACPLEVFGAFTAPADCSVPCEMMSVVAGDPYSCDPNSDTYNRDITVAYQGTNLTNLMVSIDGETPVSYPLAYQSPQTITLEGLPSNGSWVDIDIYLPEESNCRWSATDFFQNPQNCGDNPTGDCDISGLVVAEQRCNYENETYDQDLIITYTDAPSGGSILLKANGQEDWESFPITGSPQVLTLEGRTPGEGNVDIFVKFSDDNGCTFSANDLFSAPEACVLPCAITSIATGTQTACDPTTNTYSQELMIIYENQPDNGSLVVGGQVFGITGSPQMITLTNLPSDGNEVDITAYFTEDSDCQLTENNLFTAPEACVEPPTGDGEVLMVVADANNVSSGDDDVKTHLEGLGYTVMVMSDENTQSSSADDKSLIIISNSISSGQVGSKFTSTTVPVICYETYLYDDLGMTASGGFGVDNGETQVVIQDATHAMAADLNGFVSVLSNGGGLAYGYPNGNASLVASTDGSATQATVFGYDTGVSMVSGTAPARRVGIFLKDDEVSKLTSEGWALFDAAVCWAIGCQNARFAPVVSQVPPVKTYPNPFLSNLTIEWDNHAQEVQLIMRNLLGQEVLSQKVFLQGRHQLQTSNLPEGMYILQIIGDDFKREVKMVKE